MMTKQDLQNKIFEVSQLEGNFLLRSGQRSSWYFDKYQFESQPELLQAVAQHMAPLVPSDAEVLAGLEMGAIAVATALALQLHKPCVFVRKQAKAYGTQRLAEGVDIKNKKVCVVEDVITTGGQVLKSISDLKALGAHIVGLVCVLDRSQGMNKLIEAGQSYKALFKPSKK